MKKWRFLFKYLKLATIFDDELYKFGRMVQNVVRNMVMSFV